MILDENVLARGHEFLQLGVFSLSHDQRRLAYGVDHDGSERYALRFRDLASGADLPDAVDDASYTAAWAADGETVFYTRQDAAMRPHEVWRHRLGRPADEDERVFHEPDERFFVSVGLTRSRRFVLIAIESKQTSEVRFIPASDPTAEPVAIAPRIQGIEYQADHAILPDGDAWLVRGNGPAPDGSPCPELRRPARPGRRRPPRTLVGTP